MREATLLNPHWVTNGIYTLLRDAACDRGIMTLADVERVLPQEKPEMRRFDLAFPLTEAGEAVVVSIILEPCGWQRSPVAKYTVLPRKGSPVRLTKPQTKAWYEVQEGLRTVLEGLRAKSRW